MNLKSITIDLSVPVEYKNIKLFWHVKLLLKYADNLCWEKVYCVQRNGGYYTIFSSQNVVKH